MTGVPLATAFVRIRPDLRTFPREVESGVGRANLGAAGRRHGRVFGAAFATAARAGIGALAAGISAGVAGLTTGAVAAVKFQNAMLKISTQAGGSAKDVAVLSEQVLKLGTYAEQGPNQLAAALYHLKSVGLGNVAAMKALRSASDLAAVGGADLEATTNALAGAWRSGIRGATRFGDAAATLNAIVGAGNMRMQDLVDAIATGLLPVARTFGVTFKNVGAALATLTDMGMPAAEAATRLRMSLSLLGAPSAQAESWLGKIGLRGIDLAKAMRGPDGLIGALELLKRHLDASGLSAAAQAQLLSRAFGGGRQSAAILALLGHLEVLRKKQEQINASTGRFNDAVAAQRRTVSAMWGRLKSTMETVAIRIGSVLLPILVKAGNWFLNTGIPAVQRFWNQVAGPAARKAWAFLKNAFTVLATGAPAPKIPPRTPGAAPGGGPGQHPAPPLTGWDRALISVHGWLVKIAGFVTGTLWPGITRFLNFVKPGFLDLAGFLKQVWSATVTVWKAWAPFIGPVLKIAIGLIALAFRGIAWVLNHLVGPALTGFAAVSAAVAGGIRRGWKALTDWLAAAWHALVQGLRNAFAWFVGKILGFFGSIVHGAAVAFGWLPGLGGKLRQADKWFQNFRDSVNNSIRGINGRTVTVGVKMTATSAQIAGVYSRAPGGAKGLFVTDGTTPTADDVLARVSKGELIVPADLVKAGAVNHLRGKIPGFARGGAVGPGLTVRPETPPESTIRATLTAPILAMAKAFAKGLLAAAGGSGAAVANYARRFLGVPYVWGGTTPAGWDCSGFTSYVYHHFGYPAPRTSQQQQLWARPDGDVPGALVFFYGTRGAASHVGLNLGGGRMINAYGTGYGTIISPSHMAGFSGFGIPPGGFKGMAYGGTLTEPVLGVGQRSGRGYALAERGPEHVTPAADMRALTQAVRAMHRDLRALLDRAPGRTATGLAEALNRGARRAAYTGAYGG